MRDPRSVRGPIAEAVGNLVLRFVGYTRQMSAAFSQAVLETESLNPVYKQSFASSLQGIEQLARLTEGYELEVQMRAFVERAGIDLGRDSAMRSLAESRAEVARNELAAHLQRIRVQFLRHYDNVMLRAYLAGEGSVQERMREAYFIERREIDTRLVDRMGRRFAMVTLLRNFGNEFYCGTLNRLAVMELRSQGFTTAFVDRPGHEEHGMRIRLTETGEHPSFEELEREVFHPGSEALVVPSMVD